ncbi:MAG TPA: aminopeptidase P family protein [Clostridia bacterium]|nr:aminopeptidase P family protein [Clostridia bacterium]
MRVDADWRANIDWDAMRTYRINRLVEGIERAGLDALLMTRLDAVRYATSFRPVYSMWFHGTRHIVIVTKAGHVKFLVASGDYDRVRTTMPWIQDVTPFPFVIAQGLPTVVKALKELGLSKGKVGVDMLPFSLYEPLSEELPDCCFVDGLSALDFARQIKCKEEIVCLRQAAEVADIGMRTALSNLKEGATEIEVAAKVCEAMVAAGSEDITYLPLVESGEHSWLGFKVPTERRLKDGDMVYIDTGICIVNGYNADIARMPVVGKASSLQAKIYKTCYEMLQRGIEQLVPGNTTTDVLKAAEKVAEDAGFGEYVYFGILGHGVGTDLHEAPTIGDRVTGIDEGQTLEAGMVVALEPGILVPGVGGGHQEDMVLITENGPEVLTKAPFDEDLLG